MNFLSVFSLLSVLVSPNWLLSNPPPCIAYLICSILILLVLPSCLLSPSLHCIACQSAPILSSLFRLPVRSLLLVLLSLTPLLPSHFLCISCQSALIFSSLYCLPLCSLLVFLVSLACKLFPPIPSCLCSLLLLVSLVIFLLLLVLSASLFYSPPHCIAYVFHPICSTLYPLLGWSLFLLLFLIALACLFSSTPPLTRVSMISSPPPPASKNWHSAFFSSLCHLFVFFLRFIFISPASLPSSTSHACSAIFLPLACRLSSPPLYVACLSALFSSLYRLPFCSLLRASHAYLLSSPNFRNSWLSALFSSSLCHLSALLFLFASLVCLLIALHFCFARLSALPTFSLLNDMNSFLFVLIFFACLHSSPPHFIAGLSSLHFLVFLACLIPSSLSFVTFLVLFVSLAYPLPPCIDCHSTFLIASLLLLFSSSLYHLRVCPLRLLFISPIFSFLHHLVTFASFPPLSFACFASLLLLVSLTCSVIFLFYRLPVGSLLLRCVSLASLFSSPRLCITCLTAPSSSLYHFLPLLFIACLSDLYSTSMYHLPVCSLLLLLFALLASFSPRSCNCLNSFLFVLIFIAGPSFSLRFLVLLACLILPPPLCNASRPLCITCLSNLSSSSVYSSVMNASSPISFLIPYRVSF